MAADKKPVWVDEEAHAILKAWAKVQKRSMVDVASELLMNKLDEAAAGLLSDGAVGASSAETADSEEAEKKEPAIKKAAAPVETADDEVDEPEAEDVEIEEDIPETATADAPAGSEVRKVDRPSTGVRPMKDKKKQFLGGVWLV